MKDKLLNIIKASKLNLTDLLIVIEGGEGMKASSFDINPKDFLRFARQDLSDSKDRGYINSLTNSKRAIDCQVDDLLEIVGIKIKDENKDLENFAKLFDFDANDIAFKLKLIHSLNLAPSLLVSKARTIRNKLEHYYQMPKETEVKEALDVADLFIRSIEGKIRLPNTMFYITDFNQCKEENNWKVFKHIHFTYNTEKNFFHISLRELDTSKDSIEEITIFANDKEYCALLNIMFSNDDEATVDYAVKKLLKFIGHPIPTENVNVELG
ncbi:hypothetical protein SAMN05444397_10948 [Flavobacterium aquidurense]|uniref:Uncharacterized protein n=1 Tax=Flavobacterium frigidimaris TaxID=262320 RepID=A0ABX4BQA7_FLAFR|nr:MULTISPECIES: hypothetical protein [Flavobacterium]MDR7370058.1 hypothetical protein [Flavobacterium aquidurense]OXA78557.1 hypothetical protein B0A65_12530 [Flavobacterium frigidimaris]SDZ56935.1 hypothetical protein SAMN05444397_10948 [Flavobacterium aquidurense]